MKSNYSLFPVLKLFGTLIINIWLIVTIAFSCVYYLPGDPARMILGKQASKETIEAFRKQEGLDQPLAMQYIFFIKKVIKFEFGNSLTQHRPVVKIIRERSYLTIILILISTAYLFLFSFLLPLFLRLLKADRLRKFFIQLSTLIAVAPPYVLAIVSLIVFAGWFKWVSAIFVPSRPLAWLLPALILSAYPIALIMNIFDDQLELALKEPYCVRAEAMGYSVNQVVLKEALPNAVLPAIAALANGLTFFFTGTFFVEIVFGIGGIGNVTFEAIQTKDIPVLLSVCILFSVIVTIISTLLDFIKIIINPRIREVNV